MIGVDGVCTIVGGTKNLVGVVVCGFTVATAVVFVGVGDFALAVLIRRAVFKSCAASRSMLSSVRLPAELSPLCDEC